MTASLYVERMTLTDIRCFKDLSIDFEKPGDSIVLIGDNGDGKSTVLRSLAIGICDQSSASALFRELQGDHVRSGRLTGKIQINLRSHRNRSHRYRIVTTIQSLKAFERVEQDLYRIEANGRAVSIKDEQFPWNRIFASGYGPGIRAQGTSDFDRYLTVDSVILFFAMMNSFRTPSSSFADSSTRLGRMPRIPVQPKETQTRWRQEPRPSSQRFSSSEGQPISTSNQIRST